MSSAPKWADGVNILGIRGWKGQLARSMPSSFWQRILTWNTQDSVKCDQSILEIRTKNIEASRQLAVSLDIKFADDELHQVTTVDSSSWTALSVALQKYGYQLVKVKTDAVGYGAIEAWSVFAPNSIAKKHLDERQAGLGAIWAVYSDGKPQVPDVQDFTEPVDVVYTWVDSADADWQTDYRRYKELVPAGGAHPSSRDLARFTSRDELRYSLRSMEMNLPWVRHIYLVTASQIPDWLDEETSKVQVVDHQKIFDCSDQCLPTFNSHAIETQISRIDGLAEHFLYVNDDIFFGRPLSQNTFFTASGDVRYALANKHYSEASNPKLPVNQAAQRNADLIFSKYGRTTALKFRHVAHPQRLLIHKKIREYFPREVDSTAGHKFRHVDDISVPSSLAHYVAAAEGLGVPADIDYAYVDLGGDHLALNLYRLLMGPGKQMFCLNEVATVSEKELRGRMAKRVLNALFSYRSTFETPGKH